MANEATIKKPFKIEPHPNADKLDILTFDAEGGFRCIVGRNQFTLDSKVIYIEPDSVIPDSMVQHLQSTAKIKISNRIRAIKLRGCISEGLCLDPSVFLPNKDIVEGEDVSEILGIKHYEPPPTSDSGIFRAAKGANIWYNNTKFKQYVHIDRFEKHPNIIKPEENVSITVKNHGMSSRFFYGPAREPTSLLDRLLKLLGLRNTTEYLVGSHRTIRNVGKGGKRLPEEMQGEDLFIKVGKRYNMESVLKELSKEYDNKAVIFFGELIGWGKVNPLQAGYYYGLPKGECDIRIFDIMIDGKYIAWLDVRRICAKYKIPTVEEVYNGPFNLDLLKLAEAVDNCADWTGNREGIVIKPQPPRFDPHLGYVVLKKINPVYLLDKKNTCYH